MTLLSAYRDPFEGARIRYAERLAERRGHADVASVTAVVVARTGRIWAGAAGIVGAVVLAAATLASARTPGVHLTPILLAAWPAMIAAYAMGALVAGLRMRWAAAPPPTNDLQTDLARLEAAMPRAFFEDRAHALERGSMALPMMAVALLAPLTIHFVVALLVNQSRSFDGWIRLSLLIVGHAHLYLAYRCHAFARDAAILDGDDLARAVSREESDVLRGVVVVAAAPGAVLLLIPPLITAVTAILFVPLLFRWVTGSVLAERRALA